MSTHVLPYPDDLRIQPETWRERLIQHITSEALPREKFGHQPRLYALTQQIAAGLSPSQSSDDDIVFASAWLHDLGVFTGHRPEDPELLAGWDNTAYAIDRAPGILLDVRFPPDKIAAVRECIRTHQAAQDPETLEATLLRDADILEQLGAMGILRTVCKVGRDTRFPTFTDAAASLQRALDTLPALLRLPAAKSLAEPRIETLRTFLRAITDEAGGRLH